MLGNYCFDARTFRLEHVRPQDAAMRAESRRLPPGAVLVVKNKEIAYAERPVLVQNGDISWVLPVAHSGME